MYHISEGVVVSPEEALLTSKPEPVAQGHDGNCVPVRTPDDGWKCDCGYAPVAPVVKTDDLRHLATELLNRIAWEAEHENNHQTVGIQEACKQLQEELEKEAPVATVRKWEAENVVGGQGPYVRGLQGKDSRVYFPGLVARSPRRTEREEGMRDFREWSQFKSGLLMPCFQ